MKENPVSIKRHEFILGQVSKYAQDRKLCILDIGCGHGDNSFPLLELGHKVIGLDIDKDLVNECNRLNNGGKFILKDAQKVIKGLGRFDLLICSEMLEHTQYPQNVIENMFDLLKDKGEVILTIPNGYSISEILICRVLTWKGKTNWIFKAISPLYGFITGTKISRTYPFYIDSMHLQFFTIKQIKKLFDKFDIQLIKNTDIGIIPGAGRMNWLKKIECRIADYLPHFMVGGWLMVLKKKV